MNRALVIGFGSIGQRHARLLTDLGCSVAVVSRYPVKGFPGYADVADALTAHLPDYVVIANETAKHMPAVRSLAVAGYRGRLLVEKPLSDRRVEWPQAKFAHVGVAYNLRCHPVLLALRDRLAEEEPILITVRCGQHLSEWRPGRDFRRGYSASRDQGGGVLRDLSHELDYLLWLMGDWTRVSALGGNMGILGIEADEAWSILLEMQNGAIASVSLTYLDQPARRDITVSTTKSTLCADVVAGTFTVNGRTENFTLSCDDTYVVMHRAMLSDATNQICTLQEGIQVNRLIDAVEKAAETRRWVWA